MRKIKENIEKMFKETLILNLGRYHFS